VLDLTGCRHRIEGDVRDASGGVIAGAEVLPARGTWADTTPIALGAVSDVQGHYTLCVRAGAITVVARAAGYGSILIDEDVQGRRRLDIDLVPEAIVAGRAVRADTGEPVAGAKVWLSPGNWPKRIHTAPAVAVTGADGRFRIAGVAPGQHAIWVDAGELAAWTRTAVSAGDNGEVVMRLEGRAFVRGRVVEAGRPVAGARVVRTVNGRRSEQPVIADGDGVFAVPGWSQVPMGLDVVGYQVLDPHEIAPEAAGDLVTLNVRKRGVIRGRVERDGAPVPYATISVAGVLPEAYGRPPPADANGRFEITDLPAGTYNLGAISDEAQAFTATGGATVALADGDVRDDVVLELDGSAAIAGLVVDQADRPVAGVFVQYVHERTGDLCRATTADDGAFRCGMMTGGGRYAPVVRPSRESEVHFAGVAALPAVELVDARSEVTGQVLRVRLVRARIEGRVVRSSGAPYPDVSVAALESSTGSPPANAYWARGGRVTTDGDGRFAIEVWSDGTYALYARAPAGADAAVREIRAGSKDVVITLDDQGAIRGTTAGFARPPAIVARRVGDPDEAFWARVDGDAYVIEHLTPGRYVVFAMANEQNAAEPVDVYAGTTASVALVARPPSTITGRVVDVVTGAPVAGVRCNVGPYHAGAGTFGWGNLAPPTDADGRFTVEATSGTIEIGCAGARGRWSEGAARVVSPPGSTTPVTVHVVVRAGASWVGIGARIEMTQPDDLSFGHVVAELRPGGAAEQAGLAVGDAILAIDSRPVSTLTDLGLDSLIRTHDVGAILVVTIDRAGNRRDLRVTVEGAWER
jgi:hypothetical protein